MRTSFRQGCLFWENVGLRRRQLVFGVPGFDPSIDCFARDENSLVCLDLQLRHHCAKLLFSLDIFARRLLDDVGRLAVFKPRLFLDGFFEIRLKAQ